MKPDGESVFPFMNFRNKRLKYVWKLQEKKTAEPRSQAPHQEDSFFTSCCCDYESFCTFTKNHVIITADFLLFSCASNVKVPPIIYMYLP